MWNEWRGSQIFVVFFSPREVDYGRQIYMGDGGITKVYWFLFVVITAYRVRKDFIGTNPLPASIDIDVEGPNLQSLGWLA
jgi:hypothetical protein